MGVHSYSGHNKCVYLSLYQALPTLKGSDFGFKGCLCVSIAPAMAWYPPNNFPVSTISGDVGGRRRQRQQAVMRRRERQ